LDDTVSEEVRNQNVPHVVFKNARLEDAIRFLSDHGKVSYEVVDESTVRVFVKR
jgi:hypothetical protein